MGVNGKMLMLRIAAQRRQAGGGLPVEVTL
jgi:hypothetical protein